jgi:hypothetical protein
MLRAREASQSGCVTLSTNTSARIENAIVILIPSLQMSSGDACAPTFRVPNQMHGIFQESQRFFMVSGRTDGGRWFPASVQMT